MIFVFECPLICLSKNLLAGEETKVTFQSAHPLREGSANVHRERPVKLRRPSSKQWAQHTCSQTVLLGFLLTGADVTLKQWVGCLCLPGFPRQSV